MFCIYILKERINLKNKPGLKKCVSYISCNRSGKTSDIPHKLNRRFYQKSFEGSLNKERLNERRFVAVHSLRLVY